MPVFFVLYYYYYSLAFSPPFSVPTRIWKSISAYPQTHFSISHFPSKSVNLNRWQSRWMNSTQHHCPQLTSPPGNPTEMKFPLSLVDVLRKARYKLVKEREIFYIALFRMTSKWPCFFSHSTSKNRDKVLKIIPICFEVITAQTYWKCCSSMVSSLEPCLLCK